MWDEKLDFLLSSRYGPLNMGVREVGINDEDNSIAGCAVHLQKNNRSKYQRKKSNEVEENMYGMVSSIVEAVMKNCKYNFFSVLNCDNFYFLLKIITK